MVDGGITMDGSAENGGARRMSRWRIAAWVAAALFLMANFVAMQLTAGVNWSVGDFVFAAVLLFVPLGIYELVARMGGGTAYRTGVGMALVAALLLLWSSGAVGITDSDADLMYILALAVGIIGAFVARFRPEGMARAMFATALALASAGVIALVAGIVPAHNSAFEILGITGFFVALFAGSALLFREAARGGPERGAV